MIFEDSKLKPIHSCCRLTWKDVATKLPMKFVIHLQKQRELVGEISMSDFNSRLNKHWYRAAVIMLLLIKSPANVWRLKWAKVPVILCDSHEFWSLLHLTPNYNASEQPSKPTDKYVNHVILNSWFVWGDNKWEHTTKQGSNKITDPHT